ncbi:Bug family tripartite tricarboxylate transporter substrate binding protein [Cupriavidus sp. H39]|uniref:Bug family tripartite tricarboxylate transporter substrate binding protein n=1 Tax=Cupriavidus sp. H39 TaxID=3401635 RepID=UPI003D06F55E
MKPIKGEATMKAKWIRWCWAVLCVLPVCAGAQSYPTQNVRIVVPYAPGGGIDAMARVLAERLQQKWGKPVIVENKPGASTIIGAVAVTKAPPDGHTLLLTSEATITSNPFLFDKLPYDPTRELIPISQLVSLPQMVVANPSVAASNLNELVALARARPDLLSYASYGSGSLPHLFFEGVKARRGVKMTQIPYKGITPAVTAVLSGEVQLTLAGVPAAQGYLRAGKLKALAIARRERLPELPEVPTLAEAGFGDIDPHESWFGLFATGRTPASVVRTIAQDVAAVTADATFRERYVTARGFDPVFSTPEAFARSIQADRRQKEKLIRLTGAKAE